MPIRSYLLFAFIVIVALIVAVPAGAQVEPDAAGGAVPGDDDQMATPPPVSGLPYANKATPDVRSNYLNTTVAVTPAYIDNVLPNTTATPVGNFTYSILPGVSLARSTPRQQETLSYFPNFTFFEPTSSLNSIGQRAALAFQFRFSPNVSLSLQDNFYRTSNVYDQSPLFSNSVTGSTQIPATAIVAPFADELVNDANGVLSYQFGRDAMIGGGASSATFDLPNASQAAGLYNSNGVGAQVFYARRLSGTQYFGVMYQYNRILAYPENAVSETQTHTLLAFYTHAFNRRFSFSVSAGIQRANVSIPETPPSNSWSPPVVASVGWQGNRGTLAASYSRTVTAGGGLLGAYNASSITGSGGWKLTRAWNGGLSASYTSTSNLTSAAAATYPPGHIFSAQCALTHSIGEHFSAGFQYQRLQEDYKDIAVISADPNSDRESVTVTYQLNKPLGR